MLHTSPYCGTAVGHLQAAKGFTVLQSIGLLDTLVKPHSESVPWII